MAPGEEVPAVIAQLSDGCVRFVQQALNLPLDYTPETLPILDHYVRERGRDGREEIAALLAPPTGAYFGEVVRRTLGYVRWHSPGDEYDRYRLELEPFFLSFNPIGVALEIIRQGQVAGPGAHFEVLDEARDLLKETLAKHARVPTEDFYTFTMRYEVLEQVADVLFALESVRKERRHFGAEVYRAARGEPSGGGKAS
ncbi:MAG TPA: hypothetical protein VEX18_20180 [Polyangiaceae bacterium]|nr:hypothetical protein [Polyangiaceae bacterium]